MQKVSQVNIERVIDANGNRAREGYRVCEDICRFVLDDKSLTKSLKIQRHSLTGIVLALGLKRNIRSRNVQTDVGKTSVPEEFRREKIDDLFFANIQRAKESLRVLEEFAKLKNKNSAQKCKKLRYQLYALEKKVAKKL